MPGQDLLLSPHDDDAALFAAFTCLRGPVTVVVVADSYVQPKRGEQGCSRDERAEETYQAHRILGNPVLRLGLRDDDLTYEGIVQELRRTAFRWLGNIYVPALERGHAHHDMVALAAQEVFGAERLRCYSTYAQLNQYGGADLGPVGTTEVIPTAEERALKHAALSCYGSQIRINLPHFQAVNGRSEWLSGYERLHLGCGEQLWDGWINVDRHYPPAPKVAAAFQTVDLAGTKLLYNWPKGSFDYVFSQDVLEHLPPEAGIQVMNEIWRVLCPGGVMEHYVPNAGSRNDFGSPSHLSHWNLQKFEHFDVESHRWQKDRHFEGITCGFQKVSAEHLTWVREEDGVNRPQSIRVRYRAVKPC